MTIILVQCQFYIIKMKKIMSTFGKVSTKIQDKFEQASLLSGISDIIVTRWKTGQLKSTSFFACFGRKASGLKNRNIITTVNGFQIKDANFTVDQYKYLQPIKPQSQLLQKFDLKFGRNIIKFMLDNQQFLQCEIYLYCQDDKILVSDVDGTLTKSDKHGILNNLLNKNYLHQGYSELLQKLDSHGYNIVWLTMRSFPLYNKTKNYIKQHTNVEGPLLTAPQQFCTAVIKQVTKQTVDIKTNLMFEIRSTFPPYVKPFIGGLGNRENDTIVYKNAGISQQNIYIVNQQSKVCKINKAVSDPLTYTQMSKDIFETFTHSNIDLFKLIDNNHVEYKNIFTQTTKKISIQTNFTDNSQKNQQQV